MRALGRNPVYSVVLMWRMTCSKDRRGGSEDIKELMIDGMASRVIRAGRRVGELNGDTGVVGEGIEGAIDIGEPDEVVLCEGRMTGLVFKVRESVLAVGCSVLEVSVLELDIAGVSFCSTRFGKAR